MARPRTAPLDAEPGGGAHEIEPLGTPARPGSKSAAAAPVPASQCGRPGLAERTTRWWCCPRARPTSTGDQLGRPPDGRALWVAREAGRRGGHAEGTGSRGDCLGFGGDAMHGRGGPSRKAQSLARRICRALAASLLAASACAAALPCLATSCRAAVWASPRLCADARARASSSSARNDLACCCSLSKRAATHAWERLSSALAALAERRWAAAASRALARRWRSMGLGWRPPAM